MIDALFLQVIGGVALLLYGVRLTGQGFELAFGARLSRLLADPGGSRARAFGAGVLGTTVFQSSGAIVTLLISFAEVSPLPLAQSLTVVLGADLGSTLTVQILSFRIYRYAFLVIAVGTGLYLWGKRGPSRAVGQGVLGFGFMLLALRILSGAAADIGEVASLRMIMGELSAAPIVAFFWGAFLSALFQSGTAVMILLIAFTQQGVLEVEAVLPLVLGANVGATSVAFTAASGLASGGRRVAWGHLAMKAAGAFLFLPLYPVARAILSAVSPDPSRIVANAHTMFNFTLAVLFVPFVFRLASSLERLFPERRSTAPRGAPMYLDREHLPVAGAALGQVAREIVRMADMIQEMLDMGMEAVRTANREVAERIAKADDDVDRLTREIKIFLSTLGEGSLDSAQTQRSVAYISIVSDLEKIGDFIDRTLGEHIRRMAERSLRFSEEGARELEGYLLDLESMFREAVSAFVTRDRKAAEIVIARNKEIGRRERELHRSHIERLRKGGPETLESSAAHLDILSSWKVIGSHCASIAHSVLQMEE